MSTAVRLSMAAILTAALYAALALSASVPRADAVLWTCNNGQTWQHTVPDAPGRRIRVNWNLIADNNIKNAAAYQQWYWDARTSVYLPTTSDFWSSRINMVDGNYGQVPWVGLASPNGCPSTSTGIQFNTHYYWAYWMNVACHELGHALGLDHINNQTSCMWYQSNNQPYATDGEYNDVSWWYAAVHP